jgi:hypothetical protein
MLSGETANTNFILFGFTWQGLEPTISHNWSERTNQNSSPTFFFWSTDSLHTDNYCQKFVLNLIW